MSLAESTPRLMPLNLTAPHQKYHCSDGQEVKGCTTFIKLLGKELLNRWYFNLGAEGVRWEDIHKHQGFDLGKVIHARAEAYLRGFDGVDPAGIPDELLEQSRQPFERFVDEWQRRKLKVVHSELQLTSDRLRVGGTLDIIAEGPNGLGVHDLKSSKKPFKNKPYREWKLQVGGAHSILWMENDGNLLREHCIWRLGKTESDKVDVYELETDEIPHCERAFEDLVTLYYALEDID